MPHSLTHRRLKRTRLSLPSSSCTEERTPAEVEDGRAFTHLQEILPDSSNTTEAIEGTDNSDRTMAHAMLGAQASLLKKRGRSERDKALVRELFRYVFTAAAGSIPRIPLPIQF